MTDIYKPEVLSAVMQLIVDQPVLPTMFLRTVSSLSWAATLSSNISLQVIQAVTTYKSLVSFVSSTLFNRLIIKKVWTNPPLWEGFIRCAKQIAPASYAALLQLPKDQLRDVVERQPVLRVGLREYVSKNARDKARLSGYMHIFADDPPPGPATPPAAPPTQAEPVVAPATA
jgi:symplekin